MSDFKNFMNYLFLLIFLFRASLYLAGEFLSLSSILSYCLQILQISFYLFCHFPPIDLHLAGHLPVWRFPFSNSLPLLARLCRSIEA